MTNNKSLDCFREISLGEILERFGKERILVEINHPGHYSPEILYSPEVNHVARGINIVSFWARYCEGDMSLDDKVKILDYDSIKIVKSKDGQNLGAVLRFFVCKPHSFI
jgi:hypothetical protein